MSVDVEHAAAVIDKDGVDALIRALSDLGRTVIGPTVRDGAIVLDELSRGDELPYGWGVELEAGRYRLIAREDGAGFAHSAGPQSWKTYLHPQRERQWTASRSAAGELSIVPENAEPRSYAFLGVRPCDLRAIAIQDRVLAGGAHSDPAYRGRREKAFLVVVECSEPGATCFCVSMNAGPAAGPGYDLALTEVLDDAGHRFLVRAGSAQGASVLAGLPAATPTRPRARRRGTSCSTPPTAWGARCRRRTCTR